MAPPIDDPEHSSPGAMPTNMLLFRLLLLAFLLATANAWVSRHFGNKWLYFGVYNGAIGIFWILFGYLGESEQKRSKKIFRNFLMRAVGNSVLVPLLIVILISTSFISSVTVMASGVGGPHSVQLTPEGEKQHEGSSKLLRDETGIVRFIRFTTPFGKPFYLEVQGYLRKHFDLFPWTGATFRIAQDLERSPAILVRIPKERLMLAQGGRIVIEVNGQKPYDFETNQSQGAVLIGPPTPISQSLVAEWRSALKASGAPEVLAERAVRMWKNAIATPVEHPLLPGATLACKFLAPGGQIVAETHTVVDKTPVQDILLGLRE
jgi:hypothetical protein